MGLLVLYGTGCYSESQGLVQALPCTVLYGRELVAGGPRVNI